MLFCLSCFSGFERLGISWLKDYLLPSANQKFNQNLMAVGGDVDTNGDTGEEDAVQEIY